MSNYKLTYFNMTGLGEPIRFLLSYGGIDFEDKRIELEDWPQFKAETPLGQVPILEIDGQILYQTNAIARYLAKKFHLNGSNDFEAFEVDAALETINDLRQELAKWFWTNDAAQKAAAEAETFQKAAFYLGKLEATVKKNGGYFVGEKLSAADIFFSGVSYALRHMAGKDVIADYPNLLNVIEKGWALPNVKAYIEKRPKTLF